MAVITYHQRSLPLFVMLASTMAQYEGHGLEGYRLEGHGLQGYGSEGHGLQGYGSEGHGLQGYGSEGHGLEGYQGYHHRPLVHHPIQEHNSEEYELDYHAHPKYSFDYSVKDPHTGDEKEHWETRDGDKVKGSYTLMETDGTKRIVEYEADDKNGFNAVVHRIGRPKAEHEELKIAKPVYEPQYQEEYQHYEGGFVPITSFEHRH